MLRPINAQTQAPLGIFNVDATWQSAGIEGGYVGYLKVDGYGIEVAAATNTQTAAATAAIIGLVDDSTTGSAYSTMFGSLQPRAAASTLIGPSTIVGSNKLTLWTQAGLYVTDQLVFTAGTDEGKFVYATTGTGKLTITAGSNGLPVGRVLCQTGKDSGLLESLVSPIVEVGSATGLYIIYFAGGLMYAS